MSRYAARWWRRSRHALFVLSEFVLGFLVVILAALAVLVWLVSDGPMRIAYLAAPIEQAVNAQLDNHTVQLGDAVLERSEGGGLAFRLLNLTMIDGDGNVVAHAPKAAVGISFGRLLLGEVAPSSIELIGPQLAIVMRRDGGVTIQVDERAPLPQTAAPQTAALPQTAAAPQEPAGELAAAATAEATVSLLRSVLSKPGEEGASFGTLQRVGIRDARIVVVNEPLDTRWSVDNGWVTLVRDEEAVRFSGVAAISDGDEPWTLRAEGALSASDDGVLVKTQIRDFNPRKAARRIKGLGILAALDLPISTRSTALIGNDGVLKWIEAQTDIAAGYARVSEDPNGAILVDEGRIEWLYDAAARSFTIAPSTLFAGRTEMTFTGTVAASDPSGPDAGSWRYQLTTRDAKFGSSDFRSEPLAVDYAAVTGTFNPLTEVVHLERGEVVAEGASAALTAQLSPGERSPIVDLAVSLSPMEVDGLKQLWPPFVAPGAREWVGNNVLSGRLDGAMLQMRLADGVLADLGKRQGLPERAIEMQFAFDDVSLVYFKGLPPLEGVRGAGTIEGDRFFLEVEPDALVRLSSGHTIAAKGGSFEIPSITASPPVGYIRARAMGAATAALTLVNMDPLRLADDVGIDPQSVGGKSNVQLDISVPLLKDVRLDQVEISASVELEEFTAEDLIAGRDVSAGSLLMRIAPSGLELAGELKVDGIPALVNWRRSFSDDAGAQNDLVLRAQLDDAARKRLGFDLSFLNGPIDVDITPRAGFGGAGGREADVNVDLTQARLKHPGISWMKPPGRAASASFRLVGLKNGGMAFRDFTVVSGDARVSGEILLDAKQSLQRADFHDYRLAPGDDASLTVTRAKDGGLDLALTGKRLDAGPLITGSLSTEETPGEPALAGQTVRGSIKLDRVIGRNAAAVADLQASFLLSKSGWVENLSLTGRFPNGPVQANILREASKPGRILRVVSQDGGSILKFAGLYQRAEGGQMDLDLQLPDVPGAASEGLLNVYEFTVRGEPVLSSLTAATPPANSTAPNATQGVYFKRLRMPFTRLPGLLRIGEAYLAGPAVGATLKGDINFRQQYVDLSGTYVPLYALNNFLSRVPILGQILTGGDKEGVVGMTFAVRGAGNNPTVTVNPMSAIAPGVFRKIFSFTPGGVRSEVPLAPVENGAESARRSTLPAAPMVPDQSGNR